MRRSILGSLTVLALLVPAHMHAQGGPSPERAAVQRVLVAFADNIHNGNLAATDALFAPSGVHILTANAALHGWVEFRDQQLKPEMARYPELRYAHTGIESTVRGSIAWVAFRWQMSSAGEGPAPTLGRGTAVLEKIGDQWLIAHLHFSK